MAFSTPGLGLNKFTNSTSVVLLKHALLREIDSNPSAPVRHCETIGFLMEDSELFNLGILTTELKDNLLYF